MMRTTTRGRRWSSSRSSSDDSPPTDRRASKCTENLSEGTDSTSESDSDNDVEVPNFTNGDTSPSDTSVSSKCLVCNKTSQEPSIILVHLKAHGLDFAAWHKKYKFDQLSYIRFINYFRETMKTCEDISAIKDNFETQYSSILSDEKYLTPVLEEDGLLMYLVEDEHLRESEDDEGEEHSVAELKNKIKELKERHTSEIELLSNRLATMRSTMDRIISDDGPSTPSIKPATKCDDVDDSYFDSYDEVDIHTDMLSDKARTEAYQLSILKNKADFEGKAVLDVGCGTGILSLFAAQAGAKKVWAIDNSKIIFNAMDIVSENGFKDTVSCIFGKVENNDTLKNQPKVDILISEWMGYFLLQEAMLKSVLYARDHYLKKGGLMFPNAASLYILGADNQHGHFNSYGMWENVYGFKMTAMKEKAKCNGAFAPIQPHEVVTTEAKILDLDLMTCTMNDTIFDKIFTLTAKRDCVITTFVGYFDVSFTMGSEYSQVLSTGPDSIPTHWNQTVFHLSEPQLAKAGENLRCRLKCRPNPANERRMLVDVQVGIKHYQSYELL